ncbi:MAG: hydantoinase/oxoprolinase family protein, partial [Pseudomonadales bacterium]|nr:hydantoinase/oxoprolinase family protein [Pseudomonadales bacterium]
NHFSTTVSICYMMILGVDTGGTFTDFVLLAENRLTIHKVLSTPAAPEEAILQGIADLKLESAIQNNSVRIIHGSTVATNAALENKGVSTAFVTNDGFKDLLSIGRQTRSELYNLAPPAKQIPVPSHLCFETGGRLDAQGNTLTPLTDEKLQALQEQVKQSGVKSVAINLLFSFLNSEAEERIEKALSEHCFVSRSSSVLPVAGEYERGIATWLNASLGPLVHDYLKRLQQGVVPCHVAVMQSTGGTIAAEQAGSAAVRLLLSGPAGGLAGAAFMGSLQQDHPKLLTFDMGGTSTDVALIDEQVQLTDEGTIGPWPVAVPQVDMNTIGAGGGSIAFQDPGGLLQVGPESAGAAPGPACYGQGGVRPTVTDANALLGKLHPDYFLGGAMPLDAEAANKAVTALGKKLGLLPEETAQGIIDIANEHMARALRVISIQRGHSLEDFQLCCFGGAGGLHVCDLADALGMKKAIVPIHGGVLSAFGMLAAIKARQLTHALIKPLESLNTATIEESIQQLSEEGTKELLQEGVQPEQIQYTASLQLRYLGQSYYLDVPWQGSISQATKDFHKRHEARFGHDLDSSVELVNVSVSLQARQDELELPSLDNTSACSAKARTRIYLQGRWQECDLFERELLAADQAIEGPALIVEKVSTTLVTPQWCAKVDSWGNLLLQKKDAAD